MKILHLTLKKRWFDLIASGSKTIEYRKIKPYWDKRLSSGEGDHIKFDEIHFRNGYSVDAPFMRVGHQRTEMIYFSHPITGENGESLDRGGYYVLFLGDISEVRRAV